MSDDLIWQVVNHQFCTYKVKMGKGQTFCRNEHNVTGLCSRQACPLANAKYATVKNDNGRLYLYMKTAERAHMPSKLWERIKLSKNYAKALKQIDEHLLYWKSFLIHKCKQRFTKLTQVMITERRLTLREEERHYVGIAPKVRRREVNRERKALVAAKIEKSIEKELLERLKSGAYGDKPLNVDETVWKKIMNELEVENEQDGESVWDEDNELEDGEESEEGEIEYVEDEGEGEFVDVEDLQEWLADSNKDTSFGDESESESESDEESEDEESRKIKKRKTAPRKKPRVEIEYEREQYLQPEEELAKEERL